MGNLFARAFRPCRLLVKATRCRYAELRGLVQGIAVLDCLFSLARVAKRGGWVRPEMQRDAHMVDIVAGRHPMVEAMIGDRYVPNGVSLSQDAQARPH